MDSLAIVGRMPPGWRSRQLSEPGSSGSSQAAAPNGVSGPIETIRPRLRSYAASETGPGENERRFHEMGFERSRAQVPLSHPSEAEQHPTAPPNTMSRSPNSS